MIMKYASGTLFLVIFSLYSCESNIRKNPPCFDGWTTERRDVSIVIEPSIRFWNMLSADYDVNKEQVLCVHFLAQKKKYIVILPSKNFDFDTIILIDRGDHFELLERGIII